jgi:membrane protease YdiL (CAAX protease family)
MSILGLSVVIAPLAKVGVEWLQHSFPQTISLFGLDSTGPSYNFGRIYRRLLLILALALGYLGRRWLGPISLGGIRPKTHPGRHLGSGLLLGCLSFSLFLAILILLGKRSVAPAIPVQWPLRVGLALTAGLVVGVIEETIFRGFLLGGLLQDWSRFVAVLVSSTLFSATHFLRGNVRVASGLDLDVGLRGLLAHLRPLTQPTVLFPFIGLFLVGIVLAYAYLWTNSLPFAIGLHAGWVFLSKIDGFLLQEQTSIGWLYGKHGILAGTLGWIFLLIMIPLLRLWIYLPSVLIKPRRS